LAAVAWMTTSAVIAQASWEKRIQGLLRGGPVVHERLREMVVREFPDLPQSLISHLLRTYPHFFTRMATARLAMLRDRHPEVFTRLPAEVASDLHARYPHLVASAALAYWNLAASKHARVPGLMLADHADCMSALQEVVKRHPTLPADLAQLAAQKHTMLLLAVRRDVIDVLLQTDPRLGPDIMTEVSALLNETHPEAMPAMLTASFRERRAKLHELMAADPKLAVRFFAMMDEKFSDRIYAVVHAELQTVLPRHGAELASFVADAIELVDHKYPQLPGEFVSDSVARHEKLELDLLAQDPSFAADWAAVRQQQFGDAPRVICASLDKNAPGLRNDVKASVSRVFPELLANLSSFVDEHYPTFGSRVDNLLRALP
jgi:hypothetical protein